MPKAPYLAHARVLAALARGHSEQQSSLSKRITSNDRNIKRGGQFTLLAAQKSAVYPAPDAEVLDLTPLFGAGVHDANAAAVRRNRAYYRKISIRP